MARQEDVRIVDMAQKLDFLRRDPLAQAVGDHGGGRDTFARAIGVPSSTARDWFSGTKKGSALPSEVNATIAERFGFPPDWPPWLTSSALDFETAWKDKVQAVQSSEAVERDVTVPLTQGPDRDIERSDIKLLASVELLSGQTGPGNSDIGVRVSCGRAEVDEGEQHRITVTSALLEVDCGKARADESTVRGLKGAFKVEGSAGEVRCSWPGGGDMQVLAWELDAIGASLGTVTLEPGLARVVRLAEGDIISASLGAWLKSIEPQGASPSRADVSLIDRRGDPVSLPAEELSIVQKRIIEHIRKKVLRADDDGFAVLSRHEMQFVRRP